MPTIVCHGKRTKEVRFDRTFEAAQLAVESVELDAWGEPMYRLSNYMGLFIVTSHEGTLGRGMTYEHAIADFESNVNPRWQI